MIFNICEALKNRDKQNDCKYDFLTTYQCNKYSNNTKKELIESLNNNCSDKKLEFILSRTANTEKIDLSEKFLEQFDSLDEKNSEPLNIHYYALVNTVKENGISKPTILNVCTASSIDKALMFLDPVDSEHVIEISEQKYDDYFKGQDILDEGAIWDAVKNGVKGVADAVKNINAERKNTDSYRIKQEIKDKKKDLRVAKEMEKAAKDSAKYGYHRPDSSNQSNNSASSNSTSNDTNNNSNSTSFKAGSNPTFNRSRTSSNPSREEVLSPELIQQLIDSGDEATLQNIKIQAEKARQEAKKNNDKLEAEEKARKKQEEEKARKAAEEARKAQEAADKAAAEAQSNSTNQNEEFTKMGGNLTESESLEKCVDDHHICQGCGKPLSQCTCEIKEEDFSEDESQTYSVVRVGGSIGEKSFVVKSGLSKEEAQEYAKVRMKSLSPGEKKYYGIKYKVVPDKNLKNEFSESLKEDEEEVDESLTEGKDSVSKDDRDDIIFRLRKLSTEASEALSKYESLDNLEECRDILYYLVNDSRRLLDFVNDLLVSRKSESLEEVLGERKYAVQYFNKRLSKWITVGTYGNEEEAKKDLPFHKSMCRTPGSKKPLDDRDIRVVKMNESLNDSIAVEMSRDDFDKMCRENRILQGLSSSDYKEIRDFFYLGYEDFDAAVNDLWNGDNNYHSRDWYDSLLKKYTNSVKESLKESSDDSTKKYLIKKAQKVSSDLTRDAWISDQFVKSKGTRILLNIPIAKDIDSAHAAEAEARAMKVYDTNDVWWDDFVLQVDVTNWFEDEGKSESLKESLNLNEAKNIINVLNKNLRVRFKHSAGGIFSLDRTPFNEDTFNKLIKNNYKMIGDILEEQGLKYDISEDAYISKDTNLYVTIYGDIGTVIVQFDEMESKLLKEFLNNDITELEDGVYQHESMQLPRIGDKKKALSSNINQNEEFTKMNDIFKALNEADDYINKDTCLDEQDALTYKNDQDLEEKVARRLRQIFIDFDIDSSEAMQFSKWQEVVDWISSVIKQLKDTPLTEDLSQEEIHTSGISAYITDAINGEYDTINDYNEMLLALKDDSQDSAISVIEDIIKEEYTHIGQLQELLKMYASPSSEIKSGEVEAQKQIEETKDDQPDSEFDNEFGLNSGFDSFI